MTGFGIIGTVLSLLNAALGSSGSSLLGSRLRSVCLIDTYMFETTRYRQHQTQTIHRVVGYPAGRQPPQDPTHRQVDGGGRDLWSPHRQERPRPRSV